MTVGAKVNEAVKRRLMEYGFEWSRSTTSMANHIARDVIKIMQETPRERRSSMRLSDIHRTVAKVEGFNPKGPRYL